MPLPPGSSNPLQFNVNCPVRPGVAVTSPSVGGVVSGVSTGLPVAVAPEEVLPTASIAQTR